MMASSFIDKSITTPKLFSATEPIPSFPLFPRLPTELRQLIWLQTFSPRIVQIQVHLSLSNVIFVETTSIHSAATQDLKEVKPSDNSYGFDCLGNLTRNNLTSVGPVALRVCHESRQLALLHYTRAFGSVNPLPANIAAARAWSVLGLETKNIYYRNIWIDFSRDLVVIESESQGHPEKEPTQTFENEDHPLLYLINYAPQETAKIQRLAVSERWYSAYHPSRDWSEVDFDDETALYKPSAAYNLRVLLRHFKAIRELEIYEIGDPPLLYNRGGWHCNEVDFLDEDMDAWKMKLVEMFEKQKRSDPRWVTDLPALTVRRGLYTGDRWDGTFVP